MIFNKLVEMKAADESAAAVARLCSHLLIIQCLTRHFLDWSICMFVGASKTFLEQLQCASIYSNPAVYKKIT